MDSNLFAELLAGPGGFLVAIAALLYLGAREYRKGRGEDVAEARAEADTEKTRRISAESETETVRTEARKARDELLRRYNLARDKAIGAGVAPEEIP